MMGLCAHATQPAKYRAWLKQPLDELLEDRLILVRNLVVILFILVLVHIPVAHRNGICNLSLEHKTGNERQEAASIMNASLGGLLTLGSFKKSTTISTLS